MRMYELIRKKREGRELTDSEIKFIVEGYTAGTIPDYQVAAFLMAVYFQGLNGRETAALTTAMAGSGERLDLSAIPGVKVDKHSTGGVGDKTTLVLAPMVAAAGVPVAKMAGRGLGHTGGTIDKLESIPGFKSELEPEEFVAQVKSIKLAVAAQTSRLAPADKKFYALRDATATVDSISLIASSIMSKKIAGGANALILDVKTGCGAFMRDMESALSLARVMVDMGNKVGIKTVALVTDMEQPLGKAVGNALEVKEAIAALKGEGPRDLEELCLELGARMLILAGKVRNAGEGRRHLVELVRKGAALAKFRDFIKAQGGDPAVVDDPSLLPRAPYSEEVKAGTAGYVWEVRADGIASAALSLGAGRTKIGLKIDRAVGVVLNKKRGDAVAKGEKMATLYARDKESAARARELVTDAYLIKPGKPKGRPLVYKEYSC